MTASGEQSDVGLAGERTTLAWTRLGLALLGIPAAILAYAAGNNLLALAAAMVAAILGLAVLVGSLRRQRVAPGVIPHGVLPPATRLILLTGGCVLMLGLCAVFLVLG
jgi:uncharacterized membrane protein YidH (DUF202 family)